MKHTHTCQLPDRVATLTVEERSDHVKVTMRFSVVGPGIDRKRFTAWMQPIVAVYDHDPRPVLLVNKHTGEKSLIIGGIGPRDPPF